MTDPTHPAAFWCGAPVDLVTGTDGQVANATLVGGRERLDLAVLPIVPGVWSVVGLSVANTHLIDAPDGVIVVDSGRHAADGTRLRALIGETIGRPIAAVVNTHSHFIAGTGTLIADDPVEIIAHPDCDAVYRRRLAGIQPALQYRGLAQYGVGLPTSGQDADPIGTTTGATPSGSAYCPPTRCIERPGGLVTVAGEPVQVFTEHAFDCPAALSLFFPERGVVIHNLVTRTFPNMVSIAGGGFRDPLPWLSGIDELRQCQPVASLGCHGRPVVGAEATAATLQNFRDALQFVHDQTVRGANHGLTPGEILAEMRLPAHLAGDPALTATYADWAWGVPAVWQGYLGWYDGHAEQLALLPPQVEARKIVAAFGGADAAVTAAQADAEQGDLAWAGRLLRYVLTIEPQHVAARAALAVVLRTAGHRQPSWTGRNACLVQAAELRGELDRAARRYRIGAAMAEELSATALVEVLRYRIDPLRAAPANLVVQITLDDDPVVGHLRQGVLEISAAVTASPQLRLQTTRQRWVAWLDGDVSRDALLADAACTPGPEHPDWTVWWWAFDAAAETGASEGGVGG